MDEETRREIQKLERELETANEAWRELFRFQERMLNAAERREKRLEEMVKLITHTIVTVALIAAYVTVTVTGHDANGILTVLLGYLGGAAVERATNKPKGAH